MNCDAPGTCGDDDVSGRHRDNSVNDHDTDQPTSLEYIGKNMNQWSPLE